MSNKIDIVVNQRPVGVSFICPFCEEEIDIKYNEFCDMAGEPCDWSYKRIDCPKCEKKLRIDGCNWE